MYGVYRRGRSGGEGDAADQEFAALRANWSIGHARVSGPIGRTPGFCSDREQSAEFCSSHWTDVILRSARFGLRGGGRTGFRSPAGIVGRQPWRRFHCRGILPPLCRSACSEPLATRVNKRQKATAIRQAHAKGPDPRRPVFAHQTLALKWSSLHHHRQKDRQLRAG